MTSKEFILWLKGFSEGVHEYNITPKQWDIVKEKLAEVKDEPTPSLPFGVPNTAPIVTLPYITPGPSTDPYNPYKITCETNGTTGTKLTVATGSSGTITYNPSTTTLWNPSGSNWSYTDMGGNNRWNGYQATMAGYKPYQPYTTGGEDEVIKTEE
jgi:hypothetical protein